MPSTSSISYPLLRGNPKTTHWPAIFEYLEVAFVASRYHEKVESLEKSQFNREFQSKGISAVWNPNVSYQEKEWFKRISRLNLQEQPKHEVSTSPSQIFWQDTIWPLLKSTEGELKSYIEQGDIPEDSAEGARAEHTHLMLRCFRLVNRNDLSRPVEFISSIMPNYSCWPRTLQYLIHLSIHLAKLERQERRVLRLNQQHIIDWSDDFWTTTGSALRALLMVHSMHQSLSREQAARAFHFLEEIISPIVAEMRSELVGDIEKGIVGSAQANQLWDHWFAAQRILHHVARRLQRSVNAEGAILPIEL
ncbi:MAG: hypothetical protein Q9159_000320 [Coniocarpon cinnabarinum]